MLKINLICEWISIIDPIMAREPQLEKKISEIIHSQIGLLSHSNMTEIRAKHWVLKKIGDNINLDLICYSQSVPVIKREELKNDILKQLNEALTNEDYTKAAELRDKLKTNGGAI